MAVTLATPAHAESPGFDCKLAKTAVEHAICDNEGSDLPWLDKMMTELFRAVRGVANPNTIASFVESQRQWLHTRDACDTAKDTIVDCLSTSYEKRFLEIVKSYDKDEHSGTYRSANGIMNIVAFPNGSLAYKIDSSRGPPSYNSCNFSATDMYTNGTLSHRESVDPKINNGVNICSVTMTKTNHGFSVVSNGCSAYCGFSTTFDGTFKK